MTPHLPMKGNSVSGGKINTSNSFLTMPLIMTKLQAEVAQRIASSQLLSAVLQSCLMSALSTPL